MCTCHSAASWRAHLALGVPCARTADHSAGSAVEAGGPQPGRAPASHDVWPGPARRQADAAAAARAPAGNCEARAADRQGGAPEQRAGGRGAAGVPGGQQSHRAPAPAREDGLGRLRVWRRQAGGAERGGRVDALRGRQVRHGDVRGHQARGGRGRVLRPARQPRQGRPARPGSDPNLEGLREEDGGDAQGALRHSTSLRGCWANDAPRPACLPACWCLPLRERKNPRSTCLLADRRRRRAPTAAHPPPAHPPPARA